MSLCKEDKFFLNATHPEERPFINHGDTFFFRISEDILVILLNPWDASFSRVGAICLGVGGGR